MKHFITILLFGNLILWSCSEEDMANSDCPEVPAGTRFFEFQHDSGELYLAWTNQNQILLAVDDQLAKPLAERSQHINGRILKNEWMCDINFKWSWYFDPSDWALADASIELCDGNPQYVEEHLEEYIGTGRYCPWSSKVYREVNDPF